MRNRLAPRGFEVLAFPSNEFGGQEPGSMAEILGFVDSNWPGRQFPIFGKVEVNGDGAHPLYQWLKSQRSSLGMSGIKWNFAKFLIAKDGSVVSRYLPTTSPLAIEPDIVALLDTESSKAGKSAAPIKSKL
eukprot:Amastigsp_a2005_90.p3 type:complete len:131 gc:universal Amastigsp_a2005_90:297-689(+)